MQGGWIALAVGLLVLGGVIYYYNRLVFNRVRVAEAWSGIEVQLKRRADLVPALVNCVKQYLKYEHSTLTAVVEARTQASQLAAAPPAQRAPVESNLGRDLHNLWLLVETYPELKGDRQLLDLQRNLVEVEEHLQMARRYYNGAVRELNVLVESVPSNLLAKALAFTPGEFFSLSDPAQAAAPNVEL
ncbi:LemA family protein [Pseudomonas sp. 5P_3.1_Bac2]|uniref:LemA family protein n=1 Tax=Pseudomonas sp. 5P_3.1_Bac2 TaxID=2971617 RepID=UPI0021CA4FC1|nr:LemA family protein [Pseudomonas sp. 5P_3.1_Bac2]MCU1719178.1 LemA family protein [Pseudomonas sp. 5P_3.1_Bac2]